MSKAELDREQDYITLLYTRLDDLKDRATARLGSVLRQGGGTHQARVERETFSAMYRQQISQFDAAENGLCFGRLEFSDGELRYIGRLGIHADTDEYQQLLMDWRADAARPFYLATAASPGDVKVRLAHQDAGPGSRQPRRRGPGSGCSRSLQARGPDG